MLPALREWERPPEGVEVKREMALVVSSIKRAKDAGKARETSEIWNSHHMWQK